MSQSEELFRLAMDAAQLGAYRVDPGAGTIQFSGKAREVFRLPERMPIDAFRERIPEPDRALVDDAIRAAARKDARTYEVEFRLVSPDGDVCWIRAVGRFSPFDPADPHASAEHVGVMMDISAAQRVQDELRARENWFRALIENASDFITVVDRDGRITYESPSAYAAMGYRPEQLIGHAAVDFVHPDDAPNLAGMFEAVRAEPGRVVDLECRFRDATGIWHTLSGRVINLVDHPDVQGLVINSRDVTEERALEQDLQQSRRLEAIGQLAGGIAHDFNNLLTAIKGGAFFALEEIDADHPAREDLEQVLAAADRAAQLTRQLLTFSRRQPAQLRVHDLGQLVRAVVPMVSRLIGEDVQLALRIEETPALVRIDPAQFEQVLINLIVNARDAMPHGGTVEVDVSAVDIDQRFAARFDYDVKPGRYVRLCVVDTGTGIPPELREHIFEPFFTTKETGRGTGLGLATVYGIVKQAGGYIWIDADRPRGTAFQIHLPSVDEPAAASAIESAVYGAAEPDITGLHVLLCEDEDAVRSLARRMLDADGCLVTEAAEGPTALELAAEVRIPIDLLITDVVMPGMGGRELATRIRQLHPGTRILYISGYPEREIAMRGVLAADCNYLHKPFDRTSLRAAVARAMAAPGSG